jgi:L-ascorbate metabolism protein UlaG (beta-lactamase superfamily)
MKLPNNTIWHQTHSSNMLKLGDKLLVFDYARSTNELKPGHTLATGFIVPNEISAEEVYVFISHGHSDHFHPDIFTWQNEIEQIKYIVSSDITDCPAESIVMKPDESLTVNDIQIRSYPSTDRGVAFSLIVAGKHIYFSGDNAFWNWNGDIEEAVYVQSVLSQIDASTRIDIAFQVCDPRLEGNGAGGIYAFARTFTPEILVPLHTFGNYEFNQRANAELNQQGFRKTFWCIDKEGAVFTF